MIKIFISYCRENTDEKEELIKHLCPLKDKGMVEIWHDRETPSGNDWQKVIDEHLSDADVVLCLLSCEFLNSDACKQEINKANNFGKRILPVILSPCAWKDFPFADGTLMGKKHAMPSNDSHLLEISKWKDRNEAWLVVYEEIKKICLEDMSIQDHRLKNEFVLTLNDCGLVKNWHPDKEKLTLDDIYVWPEFTKSGTEDKAAVKEIALLEDIEKSRGIWIIGEDLSGKTSLAKQIFIKLQKKRIYSRIFPIFTFVRGEN